jgi:hypothetical protein
MLAAAEEEEESISGQQLFPFFLVRTRVGQWIESSELLGHRANERTYFFQPMLDRSEANQCGRTRATLCMTEGGEKKGRRGITTRHENHVVGIVI